MTTFTRTQNAVQLLLVVALTTLLGCPWNTDEPDASTGPDDDVAAAVDALDMIDGDDALDPQDVADDQDTVVGLDTVVPEDVLGPEDQVDPEDLVEPFDLQDIYDSLEDVASDSLEDAVVDLCEDFTAPGCVQSGCPEGEVCDPTVGCNPSDCVCDPETGDVICTDDCGGGVCVPESSGECCDPALEPGTGDLPFCIEGATCCATGEWSCNMGSGEPSCDAVGVVCDVDPCADFTAPGCVETGCPEGQVCDPTVGCNPSYCACDPETGGVICTDDCGGGTCVPEPVGKCCDAATEPGADGNPFCFEGHACCPDGTWACSIGDGQTFPCGGELIQGPFGEACEACCDPALEPGTGDLPFCIEGASCCADGAWSCNQGNGQPSCDEVGVVCAVDPCADFTAPGCVETGCPEGQVCDPTVGCNPSYCACDPETGDVICTDDCGGGTCVPEPVGKCCDAATEPGADGNPFCFEGHACCPDGTWACSIGDGQTFPCGGELIQGPFGEACEACCDPALEPGTGGLPSCIEGATCCANGDWSCNQANGQPSCDAVGAVCAVEFCADFTQPGCIQDGCPEGQVCDPTVGCNPSYCVCDPETGDVICTSDCSGGTCVPEPVGKCCDAATEPGVDGNPFCFEGHACCPDGTWACSIGDGQTFPCGGELIQGPFGEACEACCDPALEPGTNGNPYCFDGATCCANGTWSCNLGIGQPSCDEVGVVCDVAP